jgi:hypothetical protein
MPLFLLDDLLIYQPEWDTILVHHGVETSLQTCILRTEQHDYR